MVTDTSSSGNQGISFPGMDAGEEFRFYFRRHWLKVARYILFLALWMAAFVLLVIVSGVGTQQDDYMRRMILVILCVFFLAPHFFFLVKIYKHFLSIVIVTDKKVHQFRRTLLAVDRHENVDLWVLQDIKKTQRGVLQNILGYGSLALEAQSTQLIAHFTPNINNIYHQIVNLREVARNKTMPVQQQQQQQSQRQPDYQEQLTQQQQTPPPAAGIHQQG